MNVERFSLSLSTPLATAGGSIDEREGLLLRCRHRGEVGVGEATPLPGWTEPVGACERALDGVEGIADGQGLEAALRELPRSATAARHGLSSALLDADARADGTSLAGWLRDDPATNVPVNATIGDADPESTATRASEAVADGFDCCKVKVGARSVAADVERIAAVRDAVGDDVELRADANGTWSPGEAERALAAFADHDVALVEQPLAADDLTGHADLRGGSVDVALDESLVEHTPDEIVDTAAADALVLKPMVLGGPGEAQTLATWAGERGLDVIVTTTVDAVVARTAAVHVAAAIPEVRACGLATASMLADDLGRDPAPVSDGRIAVPDGPGLGIDAADLDGVSVDG